MVVRDVVDGHHAVLLGGIGDLQTAADELATAVAEGEKSLGPGHPHLAGLLDNLAAVRLAAGDARGAEQASRACFEVRQQLHPKGHFLRARSAARIGLALQAQGLESQALPWLELGEVGYALQLEVGDPRRAEFERALASCREALGSGEPRPSSASEGHASDG
ncbi:tetratricopeptide repeat protein [Engelhardtia mirabilis]|uniref:tetratricopeptide repeat protein n=1 Tax=Engelhardtia mirabilis TaxID=2528011 RepID=UPI00119FEE8A